MNSELGLKAPKRPVFVEFPVTKTAVLKKYGWKLRAAKPKPDYESRNKRVQRWRKMPEESVAAGPLGKGGGVVSPRCSKHGDMHRRDMKGATYEQRFCGEWWNCNDPRCKTATLIPSAGLKAQWAAMKRREK